MPEEMWDRAVEEAEGRLRRLAGRAEEEVEGVKFEVVRKVATISYRPSEEGAFRIVFLCLVRSSDEKRAVRARLDASTGFVLYPCGRRASYIPVRVDVPGGPEFYSEGWRFTNDEFSPVPQEMWDDAVGEARRRLALLARSSEGRTL